MSSGKHRFNKGSTAGRGDISTKAVEDGLKVANILPNRVQKNHRIICIERCPQNSATFVDLVKQTKASSQQSALQGIDGYDE